MTLKLVDWVPVRFRIAIATILMAGAATACSHTNYASPMIVGLDPVAPPAGAFELCIRDAETCALDAALARAEDEAKSEPDDAMLVARADAASVAKSHPDPAVREVAEIEPQAERPGEQDAPAISDDALLVMANIVNRQINGALVYRSDEEVWGRDELWALPIRDLGVQFGDCEDYALEKRAALIELGVAAERLRLATAWSRRTGMHAVLLVRVGGADFVLDNTVSNIRVANETDYTWLTVQTGPSLLSWARVAPEEVLRTVTVMTAG